MQYHGVGWHHDQWPQRLHVVANGTMMGQRYIDKVLLPHVRLFRGAVGDKFVFMDDNATCHRTLAVQDCLDSEGIQRLVWPARSPDLNPIENAWDALGMQVAGRNYPPTNKNTLIRALTEEWDKLPQQLLDNVVQSMVRRVECCITLHGGHIPY
ncbi:DDE_3 domain-containing protein [Trichonephila clavipes]|nr:DDE_3 domain-containing protein [Trichonephila clavipes]